MPKVELAPRSEHQTHLLTTVAATVAQEAKTVSAASVHLDAIRGIAALVVFFGHARQMFLMSPTQAILGVSDPRGASTTSWGHQAVIVFFVLSGYLVGGSILRNVRLQRCSWSGYALNRMTRLWIVLIPAVFLGWALDTWGLAHFAGQQTIYQSPPEQNLFVGNLTSRLTPGVATGNILFLQTIRVDTLGTNDALWSLANEFWYYAAFPFLAIAVWGRRRAWIRVGCAFASAAILLFVGSSIAFYFSIWLAGVGAAALPCRIPSRLQHISATISTLVFVALNVLLRKVNLPIKSSDSVLAVGFVALLYCLLHLRQPAHLGIYQRVAQFLSRMSYTLYLTHLPALALVCAIMVKPWHRWATTPWHLMQFSFVVACVFCYSVLVFYCFEAHTSKVRRCLAKLGTLRFC